MGIFLSVVMCLCTFLILRGGWRTPNQRFRISISRQAIVLAVLSIAGAVWFFGPLPGIAIIVVIVIHEFGHVAAFRVCGHHDATFRLVPLLGGIAISQQRVSGAKQSFFISLLGPAICIAPTALAIVAFRPVQAIDETAGAMLWYFSIMSGALNFFNLLPLGPLDGGKCTRIIVTNFWPKLDRPVSIAMIGFAVILALFLKSTILLIFVLMSAPNALQPADYRMKRPVKPVDNFLMLGAYLATAGFFFWAGFPMLSRYV